MYFGPLWTIALQWRHNGAVASQTTGLRIVHSIVYSDADQRKHQSSASLAFVRRIDRDRWIPRTNGQLRGKCFHLMTSSWISFNFLCGYICQPSLFPIADLDLLEFEALSSIRDCKSGRHILWHCTSSLSWWWHGINLDWDYTWVFKSPSFVILTIAQSP